MYQVLYDLALAVEEHTRYVGPDFRWLRNQMLRSSESVCANLTEGFYSQYSTEYLQSLFRCRREGRETMTHLRYGRDAEVVRRQTAEDLLCGYEEGMRQLSLLIASVERKLQLKGKGRPGSYKVKEETGEYEFEEADSCSEPLTINH